MTDDHAALSCICSPLGVSGALTLTWTTAAWVLLAIVGFVVFLAFLFLLVVVFETGSLLPNCLVIGGIMTYFFWTRYGWPIGIASSLVAVTISFLAMLWENSY